MNTGSTASLVSRMQVLVRVQTSHMNARLLEFGPLFHRRNFHQLWITLKSSPAPTINVICTALRRWGRRRIWSADADAEVEQAQCVARVMLLTPSHNYARHFVKPSIPQRNFVNEGSERANAPHRHHTAWARGLQIRRFQEWRVYV